MVASRLGAVDARHPTQSLAPSVRPARHTFMHRSPSTSFLAFRLKMLLIVVASQPPVILVASLGKHRPPQRVGIRCGQNRESERDQASQDNRIDRMTFAPRHGDDRSELAEPGSRLPSSGKRYSHVSPSRQAELLAKTHLRLIVARPLRIMLVGELRGGGRGMSPRAAQAARQHPGAAAATFADARNAFTSSCRSTRCA